MTHAEAVQRAATERYLLDEMTPEERDAFEAHYFDCPDCAEEVRTAARMRDGARAGLIANATTWPAARRRSWVQSAALPWAAAATLALVAGYEAVQLRQPAPQAIQALSPVTLRPASRGAEPIVALPAAGHAATFAIDLPEEIQGTVAFTVQRIAPNDAARGGRSETLATGTVAAPPAGAPLLLLIPASVLNPEQHYVLAIRRPDGRLLGEYPFAVAQP